MNPVLQPQHIEALYAFTKAHFVPYYEIQAELVDHLASDIEAQWEDHPKLSFEQALQVAFKKFGVFGFQDVVEQRTASMYRLYNQMFWQCAKPYIVGRQLWITLSLLIGFYLAFSTAFHLGDLFVVGLFVLLVVLYVTAGVFQAVQRSKRRKKHPEAQRWLFHHIMLQRQGGPALFLGVSLQLLARLGDHSHWIDEAYMAVVSVLFTCSGIIFYINQGPLVKVIQNYWAEQYCRQYPQAPELT